MSNRLLETGDDRLLESGDFRLLEVGVATVGKIPKLGFGAGAIKYVVLAGFSPNDGSGPQTLTPDSVVMTWTIPSQTLSGSGSAAIAPSSVVATWTIPSQSITGGDQWTVSTAQAAGGSVMVKTDSDGNLIVVPVPSDTAGPLTLLQNIALGTDATGLSYLCVVERTAGSLATPLTPLANLLVKGGSSGALQVAEKTAGSLAGPLTPLDNLRVRTDENGYVLVAYRTLATPSTVQTTLANAMCRVDENGYLLVAEGAA